MYETMIENTRKLSDAGMFVSAESMINYRTHRKLPEIHRMIVEMGCKDMRSIRCMRPILLKGCRCSR